MKTMFRSLALLLTLFSLSGCGLKGPLYFPPQDNQAKPATPAQPQTQTVTPNRNDRGDNDGPTQVIY
ncbi:LPS translocon maturation chaperone LptM [Franconibacter pulveris 1160]|jgi:predicted small lipoprotein YifL|uniref:LPS-assembly lipoprotein LptM n=1 Tax=Franconibacter daqui TaxID=2047724 RepID=A0ABV1PT47_9ENTR|nr:MULTISPECIES: lipoprotein [Franconibacter]MCK1970951.1 lipoprotein [Franconibacter sp. IITDAS19]HBI11863.1 hypothetical protein [Franconibacter pulveris]